MTNLLLETYWLALAVAVTGLGIAWAGNNRTNPRMRTLGLAIVALAVGLAALSYFVESDREQVARHTREFAQTVVARDWARVRPMLHPHVRLYDWEGPDDIINGAKKRADQYGLHNIRLAGLNPQWKADQIAITFTAVGELTHADMATIPTTWQFLWTKTPSGWQIEEIEPLSIFGQSSQPLESQFRGKP